MSVMNVRSRIKKQQSDKGSDYCAALVCAKGVHLNQRGSWNKMSWTAMNDTHKLREGYYTKKTEVHTNNMHHETLPM